MTGCRPTLGYVLPQPDAKPDTSLTLWPDYYRPGERRVALLTLTKRGRLTQRSRRFLAEHFPEEE